MAGMSVSSTASSFFNKLRGKSNPYEKAHRPQSYNTTSTQTTNNTPSNVRPNNDLLAEAREAAGRDPVTGRRRAHLAHQTLNQQQPALHGPKQTPTEQRAAQRSQERAQPYSSYEEFVQEMIERRDGKREATDGASSYYAPERRVQEYYS
jgi:hypothetical protein